MGNAGLRDEQKIREGIARADFVRKGKKNKSQNRIPHQTVEGPRADKNVPAEIEAL